MVACHMTGSQWGDTSVPLRQTGDNSASSSIGGSSHPPPMRPSHLVAKFVRQQAALFAGLRRAKDAVFVCGNEAGGIVVLGG